MPNFRKSLSRNFWHHRAQKPPSLTCVASQAIDETSTCSVTASCSASSVKFPSHNKKTTRTIPALLLKCSKEIQKRGIDTEGIFRRSGNTSLIEKLLTKYSDVDDPRYIDLDTVPIHSLTGLFKRYLQQLSEPVIPKLFQHELLNAYESTLDSQEKIQRINAACQLLPVFHDILLRFVIKFAHTVSCHVDQNKMSAENLSIIFAPTCIRLDGVGQLLSNSQGNMEKVKSSQMQKPVKIFRTLSLRKTKQSSAQKQQPRLTLSKSTFSCDKLASQSIEHRLKPLFTTKNSRSHQQQIQRSLPKYEPQDLLQLGLVKESGRWNKFFQFMIENAPKFNYYISPSSLEEEQNTFYHDDDEEKASLVSGGGSSNSLTSPKVRRIKDIFGSMLSMFPDIAQDLNIIISPTASPSSRAHRQQQNDSSSSPISQILDPFMNGAESNTHSITVPSNNRSQPYHTAFLSSPAAAVPISSSHKRNSSDTWTLPMAPLRRTLTTEDVVSNEGLESPTQFTGTKYEAIWQHWKEREEKEEEERQVVPTVELKNCNNPRRSDWLKSLSQNVDFATPPTNKRPISVAIIPSARPNYFLR
ncbi:hypothetical protein BDA99DRAFT_189206 [Phascolomyces articulosus]|uniref:Rho-GAP domain-containing protein n=1 Tax=Phascolomyces articulosus TaxID=60185 RepID=A0AAD5PI25_9FUNG|nr:hypothetical protein BDA99DRAFT_189206 [Phascolomyces articulosus]